jgi:hypothetical protein
MTNSAVASEGWHNQFYSRRSPTAMCCLSCWIAAKAAAKFIGNEATGALSRLITANLIVMTFISL